jgi:phosphoribosylamine--glycine ligase
MERAGMPVPRWEAFTTPEIAVRFMDELGSPYVIKADGLAAGKGVLVTRDRTEAIDAIEDRLVRGVFGEAGRKVIVEEYLDGEEVSLIAFTDGHDLLACEPAQDYKRVFDSDAGPNTGGMGSYSPVPACPADVAEGIVTTVMEPVVRALGGADAAAPFVGALYAGLVLTDEGPRVLEFNARFGDPETQALLPRLDSDLAEVAAACATGELAGLKLEWSPDVCVCVVLASQGYPGSYETGTPIRGIGEVASLDGVHVFHAGTSAENGRIVTSGGRVVAVSALADGFERARRRVYEAANRIEFHGKHLRSDIALKAERAERKMSA